MRASHDQLPGFPIFGGQQYEVMLARLAVGRLVSKGIRVKFLAITQYLLEVRDALAPFSLPLTNANDTLVLVERLRVASVTPEKIRETVTALLGGGE